MLRCEACGRRPETEVEAHGWRAYLTAEADEESADLAVYCPKCADREFGQRDPADDG